MMLCMFRKVQITQERQEEMDFLPFALGRL